MGVPSLGEHRFRAPGLASPLPWPGPEAPDRCDNPLHPSPKGQTKHSKYLIRAREPRRPPRPLRSRLAPPPAPAALRGNEAGNGKDRSRPGAGWGWDSLCSGGGIAVHPKHGVREPTRRTHPHLHFSKKVVGESPTDRPLLRCQVRASKLWGSVRE